MLAASARPPQRFPFRGRAAAAKAAPRRAAGEAPAAAALAEGGVRGGASGGSVCAGKPAATPPHTHTLHCASGRLRGRAAAPAPLPSIKRLSANHRALCPARAEAATNHRGEWAGRRCPGNGEACAGRGGGAGRAGPEGARGGSGTERGAPEPGCSQRLQRLAVGPYQARLLRVRPPDPRRSGPMLFVSGSCLSRDPRGWGCPGSVFPG